MDLHTESLDFSTFQLFICLFLTANRLSPHDVLLETHPRSMIHCSSYSSIIYP